MELKEFIKYLGIKSGSHLLIHSSIRQIRSVVPEFWALDFIKAIAEEVTSRGSIIMPTFTYNFKRSLGRTEKFDRETSESKVGDLTEVFRNKKDVIRTSSATHSFALWGMVKDNIYSDNSPTSPLGEDSVLEWLSNTENSYILLLGTDFKALSYGHYLENVAKVPWYNISPWDHLNVLPIGVSTTGEQKLLEVPGCAKSFVNFEKYLVSIGLIKFNKINSFGFYLIPVQTLYQTGLLYFKKYHEELLCKKNTCLACDERRMKLGF